MQQPIAKQMEMSFFKQSRHPCFVLRKQFAVTG
jgi:hypothetical protein